MSNYHVLQISNKKDKAWVAFHIAVPDENNSANKNLRVALKEQLEGLNPTDRVITNVPWLETEFAAEYAQIKDCEVYEHYVGIKFDPALTVIQKRNILDQKYTNFAASIPNTLRERLKFWGLNRDVP